MPNTNFQTFHQMKGFINDQVKQATSRLPVQNINMDWVTVGQNTRLLNFSTGFKCPATIESITPPLTVDKCIVHIPFSDSPHSKKLRICISGVNLWDGSWEKGYWDTQTGNAVSNNSFMRSKYFIQITPNTEYRLVCTDESVTRPNDVLFYDDSGSYIGYIDIYSNSVFTTPDNCYFIKFYMNLQYGNSYKQDISINFPSTQETVLTPWRAIVNVDFSSIPEDIYEAYVDIISGEIKVINGELVNVYYITPTNITLSRSGLINFYFFTYPDVYYQDYTMDIIINEGSVPYP